MTKGFYFFVFIFCFRIKVNCFLKRKYYLTQKELLIQNINELFGNMLLQTITKFVKHNITKHYVNIDFGTKFIRPKMNSEQKKQYDALESKEDQYNYLLSLIPNLNTTDLEDVIYILVAKYKIRKIKRSVTKCNTIINCNLESLKKMIEKELQQEADENAMQDENNEQPLNQIEISDSNGQNENSMQLEQNVQPNKTKTKKPNYIENLINGDSNFRFKESDELHVSKIKQYYENALIIKDYLSNSTDKSKIVLQKDEEYSNLIDSNDIFEKGSEAKMRNELQMKKLEKKKKEMEEEGQIDIDSEEFELEQEDEHFSKKIEIKSKKHKNKKSYGIKQFNDDLDMFIPSMLEKNRYRVIKLERGIDAFSPSYLKKKLISVIKSDSFNSGMQTFYKKNIERNGKSKAKEFNTVSIQNKLPKRKKTRRNKSRMGNQSTSHIRRINNSNVHEQDQLNQVIQSAMRNFT